MNECLIMLLGYLACNVVAIGFYMLKDKNKLEIMDVSSELRKIDKTRKFNKERMF